MLTVSSYVAPSAIDGLGVFAGEYIRTGDVSCGASIRSSTSSSRARRSRDTRRICRTFISRYSYPHLEIPGFVIVDCDNGRFMNHSLTPNTDFRIFDKGYALVDIAQGDELTCNYHEFDPSFVGYFPTVQVAAVDAARLHASGR